MDFLCYRRLILQIAALNHLLHGILGIRTQMAETFKEQCGMMKG